MLGAGRDPSSRIRRPDAERVRSLQIRIASAGTAEANRRLAGKIQKSIASLIEREMGIAASVARLDAGAAGPPPAAAISASRPLRGTVRSVPPGCGAWWNF